MQTYSETSDLDLLKVCRLSSYIDRVYVWIWFDMYHVCFCMVLLVAMCIGHVMLDVAVWVIMVCVHFGVCSCYLIC